MNVSLQEKYQNLIYFSKIRISISNNENKVDIGIDAQRVKKFDNKNAIGTVAAAYCNHR